MDEQTILYRAMVTANPGKEQEIKKIIDDMATEKPFDNYTFVFEFSNGNMRQKFINNRTGEQTYNSSSLPVTVRNLYNKLFNKLYFRYCQ
jgi:hypothetical protein